MAKEPKTGPGAAEKRRARRIADALFDAHPDAHCALHHNNAFELLCATILSAQCTDERVNEVTPELFRRFPDAASLAAAEVEEVEELVRSTGFFKNKTKSLLGMAAAVHDEHGGDIPRTLEELVRLPGVGRKTANVILGNVYDVPGLVVDTHVARLSQRLGLTEQTDAVRIEAELCELLPPESWTQFSHATIFHGRRVCKARKPLCGECDLAGLCPSMLEGDSG